MTDNLERAVQATEWIIQRHRESIEYYVSQVVSPLLRDLLAGASQEIHMRHRVDDPIRSSIEVVHYTSIGVLFKMLQEHLQWSRSPNKTEIPRPCFRLYDSVHVNDLEEGTYLTNRLPSKYNWLNKTTMRHAYLSSFICTDQDGKAEDSLVFWRTYGGEGQGCSLRMALPTECLRRVLYGRQPAELALDRLLPVLATLDPLLDKMATMDRPTIRDRCYHLLAEAVWESLECIRYLYKSDEYAFEKECRVIHANPGMPGSDKITYTLDDRGSSVAIRHYHENNDLPLERLSESGSKITIGPCVPHKEDVTRCVSGLLKQWGGEPGSTVTASSIPYQTSR